MQSGQRQFPTGNVSYWLLSGVTKYRLQAVNSQYKTSSYYFFFILSTKKRGIPKWLLPCPLCVRCAWLRDLCVAASLWGEFQRNHAHLLESWKETQVVKNGQTESLPWVTEFWWSALAHVMLPQNNPNGHWKVLHIDLQVIQASSSLLYSLPFAFSHGGVHV